MLQFRVRFAFVALMVSLVLVSGCGHKQSARHVVTIGAILPLTGEAAKYGTSSKNGIDLAVSEINKAGGVHSNKLVVIYEDDQATPAKGVSAFQKLATVDKVPAIIGAMASSVTLAVAPIANKEKVVLLSPMSSNPKITESGDYVFRNCVSDLLEGSDMAKCAFQRLKLRRVAILYINNDYGVGLRDVFRKTYTEQGGQVVAAEGFAQGATDFRSQLSKIRATSPDAVYLVGYNEMIQVFKQARQLGMHAQFLSTIMLNDPDLVKKTEGASEGAILTAWAYDPQSKDKAMRGFVEAYKNRYGTEPDVFAAQAYDATKLIAKAMNDSGVGPDNIMKSLYSIKSYPGASGTTTFDRNGDVVKPLRFLQVSNGAFIPVK